MALAHQRAPGPHLCPTQCIDCSLMHVLKRLGHKNLQLLLGMRSCNKH